MRGRRFATASALAVFALLVVVAFGSTAAAQQSGSGSAGRCATTSEAQFERLGERVMDRMMGSAQAHQAMDARMRSIMGAAGERHVHVFMGRRFSGCGGRLPGRFGPMMGAVGMGAMMSGGGMMGGPGAYGGPGSMMYGRPGSMMGYYGSAPRSSDDDEGPSAAAMIGMMAVLIGAVALALLLVRPRRRGPTAIDLLDGRFARGELSAEEYRQSRRLLDGGASR